MPNAIRLLPEASEGMLNRVSTCSRLRTRHVQFFFFLQWASSRFQVFQDESRLRIGVTVCVEGGKRTRRVRGTPSNSSCVSVIISSVREYPTCGVCNQGLKLILECHAARGNLLRYSLRFVVWSGTFKVTRWSGLILNNW